MPFIEDRSFPYSVYISIIIAHKHFLIVIVVWDVLFPTEPANESWPKTSNSLLGRFANVIDGSECSGVAGPSRELTHRLELLSDGPLGGSGRQSAVCRKPLLRQ